MRNFVLFFVTAPIFCLFNWQVATAHTTACDHYVNIQQRFECAVNHHKYHHTEGEDEIPASKPIAEPSRYRTIIFS